MRIGRLGLATVALVLAGVPVQAGDEPRTPTARLAEIQAAQKSARRSTQPTSKKLSEPQRRRPPLPSGS